MAFVQRLGLKLESKKGEARAWELHQTLCELWGKLVGISYVFLLYVVEKRILLGFLGFCTGTFPIFRTLLPEVSGVVPFCVCE